MGMSRNQLKAIATMTGFPVREAWVSGHGPMGTVQGVMLHHTGTKDSSPGDFPTLRVVQRGRPDLDGPLCNYGLGRSGTIYLVTEGRAYHAGPGKWMGITAGNSHFLGIEAENGGTGNPWPAVQLDAYQRLVASILHALGRNTNWDVRHADWALPAGRKVDTKGFTMNNFDAKVKQMLAAPATINRHNG
jgi:N-acetylmuramoyl-L-alanine amidase